MQARKDVKARKEAVPSSAPVESTPPADDTGTDAAKPEAETDAKPEADTENKHDDNKEEIDIDLNDPDVQQAATKIQAGFKGMKTRKELKDKVAEGETETAAEGDKTEQPSDKGADNEEKAE